ncbi:MAG: hypothetical protein KJZ86_25805 [Caldilineaceae bacterium]|nr:hypothetical protein [Caldilineaceae bacterium]
MQPHPEEVESKRPIKSEANLSPLILGGAVALGAAIGLWQITHKSDAQKPTQQPLAAPPANPPAPEAPPSQPPARAIPSPAPSPRPAPQPPVDPVECRPAMPVYIPFGTTGINVPYYPKQ